MTFDDRTVADWTGQGHVSALPNGVNWAARATPFAKGGYANAREYGFLWMAAARPGRPLPYVRIAKFRTADHTLIEEEDLWSNDIAWLYPVATTNAVGHVGCVVAAGGTAMHPVTALLIVDDCRAKFAGAPAYGFAFSTHSPTYARWGDYFSMQRHPARTLGFVTSGLAQTGGSQTTDQQPRYLHFGQSRDALAWSSALVDRTARPAWR
jgi:hypothetical protein